MGDLISRKATIELLRDLCKDVHKMFELEHDKQVAWHIVFQVITYLKEAPAARDARNSGYNFCTWCGENWNGKGARRNGCNTADRWPVGSYRHIRSDFIPDSVLACGEGCEEMNGDLISREAAAQMLMEKSYSYVVSLFPTSDECKTAREIAKECAEAVRQMPAVDAVEVVRCKDCESATDIGTDYLICGGWGFRTDHNGFCYRGAKMDKEE